MPRFQTYLITTWVKLYSNEVTQGNRLHFRFKKECGGTWRRHGGQKQGHQRGFQPLSSTATEPSGRSAVLSLMSVHLHTKDSLTWIILPSASYSVLTKITSHTKKCGQKREIKHQHQTQTWQIYSNSRPQIQNSNGFNVIHSNGKCRWHWKSDEYSSREMETPKKESEINWKHYNKKRKIC